MVHASLRPGKCAAVVLKWNRQNLQGVARPDSSTEGSESDTRRSASTSSEDHEINMIDVPTSRRSPTPDRRSLQNLAASAGLDRDYCDADSDGCLDGIDTRKCTLLRNLHMSRSESSLPLLLQAQSSSFRWRNSAPLGASPANKEAVDLSSAFTTKKLHGVPTLQSPSAGLAPGDAKLSAIHPTSPSGRRSGEVDGNHNLMKRHNSDHLDVILSKGITQRESTCTSAGGMAQTARSGPLRRLMNEGEEQPGLWSLSCFMVIVT